MNRIKAGHGQPEPERRRHPLLHRQPATGRSGSTRSSPTPIPPARFDSAAGRELQHRLPVRLGPVHAARPGKTERFSLALAYGARPDRAAHARCSTVQQIYNANYQFAVPPPLPTRDRRGRRRLRAALVGRRRRARRRPGDRTSTTSRATASTARPIPSSATRSVITTGTRHPARSATASRSRSSTSSTASAASRTQTVEGVAYYLGNDTGIRHTWTDTHGDQRPAVLLRGHAPTTSARDSLGVLPVGERDHGLAHAARRADPADERGRGAARTRRCSGYVPAAAATAAHGRRAAAPARSASRS